MAELKEAAQLWRAEQRRPTALDQQGTMWDPATGGPSCIWQPKGSSAKVAVSDLGGGNVIVSEEPNPHLQIQPWNKANDDHGDYTIDRSQDMGPQ